MKDLTRPTSTSGESATKPSAENQEEETPWWTRLFCRRVNKDRRPKEPVGDKIEPLSPPDMDTSTTREKEKKKKKKSGWISRLFKCFRSSRVSPTPGEEAEQKTPVERVKSPAKVMEETPCAPSRVDPVKEEKKKKKKKLSVLPEDTSTWASGDRDRSVLPEDTSTWASGDRDRSVLPEDTSTWASGDRDRTANPVIERRPCSPLTHSRPRRTRKRIVPPNMDRLGFPNPGLNCYMNSSLQSLIPLADFTRDFSRQKAVWSSAPEAELIRRFMNVVGCHRSAKHMQKLKALSRFKSVLSVQAPEFEDDSQKDAHEFLMTVVEQIRSLSRLLQARAAIMGQSYRCPVNDHLGFKMRNTRTCKGCGAASSREEEFTNLSLDVTPEGSIQEMLQDYMKETSLEYRCECGADASGQQTAFLTLPRVLILHLKRFSFSPSLRSQKLNNPVDIFRELNVSSGQGDGLYKLVSVINHLGSEANSGHYISNGPNPEVDPDDPTDSWLTFNDAQVSHTSGDSVCVQSQQSAYVLFYQRRM